MKRQGKAQGFFIFFFFWGGGGGGEGREGKGRVLLDITSLQRPSSLQDSEPPPLRQMQRGARSPSQTCTTPITTPPPLPCKMNRKYFLHRRRPRTAKFVENLPSSTFPPCTQEAGHNRLGPTSTILLLHSPHFHDAMSTSHQPG